MVVNGAAIAGAQNIIFAQLSDPTVTHFSLSAARYFSGEYLIMLFGLPGASYAMYKTSDDKSKKVMATFYFSAALTSILTGITEPVEFAFLFVAPMLYGIHVIFNGIAFIIAQILNITIGFTFSASVIDFIVLGVLQGNEKTNWILIIPLGLIYFGLYYFSFKFIIKKFNIPTPGRDSDEKISILKKPITFDETLIDPQSMKIVQGLGGRYNFTDLDCCVTRLRAFIIDTTKVDEPLLKQAGAAAIMHSGDNIQVIFGPKAATIKRKVDEYLDKVPAIYDVYHDTSKEINDMIVLSNLVDGEVFPIDKANDMMFANKLMGDGVVIVPSNGTIVSPCDGIISMIYPTKHAIGIKMECGYEVLIHFGTNTVNLEGKGFEHFVKMDQKVHKGELLWNADIDYIKAHATDANIIVCITNMKSNTTLNCKYGHLSKEAPLIEIEEK